MTEKPFLFHTGYSRHNLAQQQLLHSEPPMSEPPSKFEPGRMYRVQLSYPVSAIPDHPEGHVLRPSDGVMVSGEFANTIIDAIVAAKIVG